MLFDIGREGEALSEGVVGTLDLAHGALLTVTLSFDDADDSDGVDTAALVTAVRAIAASPAGSAAPDGEGFTAVREGAELTEDELREFCRSRVAHFKVPRYFKFTTDFPMTVTGKIQKFKMREMAIEELGLEAAASITTA